MTRFNILLLYSMVQLFQPWKIDSSPALPFYLVVDPIRTGHCSLEAALVTLFQGLSRRPMLTVSLTVSYTVPVYTRSINLLTSTRSRPGLQLQEIDESSSTGRSGDEEEFVLEVDAGSFLSSQHRKKHTSDRSMSWQPVPANSKA